MQPADRMQHLSASELLTDDEIVAKIIIMIYEVNQQGDSEVPQRLRIQYRLQGWDYVELAHKDSIPEVAQQNLPQHILRMKEFLRTEINFFEKLKEFIIPSYINYKGVKVNGGWEFIKQYLSQNEINDMQDLINIMQQLYQSYCTFQFMQNPIVASVMHRLDNNPQLFFKFWVDFLYISSQKPSPYPLFHSVLPYQFAVTGYRQLQNVTQTISLIVKKLAQKSQGVERLFALTPVGALVHAYFEDRLIEPVQRSAKYGLIFSDLVREMNDNDPLFTKMLHVMTYTNSICTRYNQLLHRPDTYKLVLLLPKWLGLNVIDSRQCLELVDECHNNPNARNVPFYMKKYNLTFSEAKSWASKDLQNWFLRFTHLRRILPNDIYFYIAALFVPVTPLQALSILNKVLPVFNLNLSSQVLNNYLTGRITTLAKPQITENLMQRAVSFSLTLFKDNSQTPVEAVTHYMNAARMYKAFNSIRDFSLLRDILHASAAELKQIINRPADDRYEHFINFILQKLEDCRLIARAESEAPKLKGV